MVFTIGLGDTILQEHIPGASFFIMMIVIIKSSPETIKQISFLLNYEVNNNMRPEAEQNTAKNYQRAGRVCLPGSFAAFVTINKAHIRQTIMQP